MQNFCDLLGALETREQPDGSKRQVRMMYTAVIHAPDLHNDERNYHLHVIAHDRPARYLNLFRAWDFEVEQHFQHKGEKRVRFPFRQPKIALVSQSANKTGNQNLGRGFVPHLRREFARITNEVLKARGFEHSYDPRSYKAMGIDRTPTEHLGTKAHALEAIGVPTTVGKLNAVKIWHEPSGTSNAKSNRPKRSTRLTSSTPRKFCAGRPSAFPVIWQYQTFKRAYVSARTLSMGLPKTVVPLPALKIFERRRFPERKGHV